MRIPRWLDPRHARRELEEDLARELETHLAIARDEQQERGLSATDARQAARRQFGNVTYVGSTATISRARSSSSVKTSM